MKVLRYFAIAVLTIGLANAQSLSGKIDLPNDSPVALLTADFSNSKATARGGAYLVDVNASVTLRNTSQKRIRGITLAVYSTDVSPGKGSVSVPSLDVAPGAVFSVRIENHLVRPLSAGSNAPGVEVKLDGVLFDDLVFYGPDALESQRVMTKWELEARQDRDYFKAVLKKSGPSGLDKEMLVAASRQTEQRGPNVQVVRGRATNQEGERDVRLAFLSIPDAPVEASDGTAAPLLEHQRSPRAAFLREKPLRARGRAPGNGLDRKGSAGPRILRRVHACGPEARAESIRRHSPGCVAALPAAGLHPEHDRIRRQR